MRGERPVIRSDGQFTRDYLYVEDGARAYLLLAEQLAATPGARAARSSTSPTSSRMTVLELVARILAVMGSDLEPDVRNEASNEIRDQYLDATKARTMLGWSPAFTFDDGPARDGRLVPGVLRVAERTDSRRHPVRRGGHAPGRADRGASEAARRDRRPADPLAHHEALLALRLQRVRAGARAQGRSDQALLPGLPRGRPGHDDLAAGRPRRAAEQRHGALEGAPRRHRRGDVDGRPAPAAAAAHRRRHVHADVRRRRGERAGSTSCWRFIARAARW